MKFVTLFLMLLPAFAQAEHSATHGMVLLGTEKIYLSHLPMFHAPHDQQVIFSVEIDAEAKAKLKKSRGQGNDFFTIVPEPFKLGEIIAHPHDFSAEIYQGHFERGGTLIAEHVKVSAVKLIYQKQLFANAPAPNVASFIVFGDSAQQWLAHVIHGAPDFDQLVELDNPASKLGVFEIPGLDPTAPLKANTSLKAKDGSILKTGTVIYTEFEDLSG